MRYLRFVLPALLTLAAMLLVAQAVRDSVEAGDGPSARAPVGMPTAEVDDGQGPRAGDIIPGRYIVRLEDRASPKALAARHGLRPQVVYRAAVKGFAGRLSDKDVKRLRADPNVVSIEPDRIVTADDQTVPTGVDRIDADLNTAAKIDGIDDLLDVDIAVLDTGIQPDHPDLRVVGGATFLGESCDGGSWADDHGHGTHVAGTAAALDNDIGVVGVAPGARLWAVKVLDSGGSGSTSCVIAGIDWVTANADTIEVANMSLGGSDNPFTCDAIASSAAAGVVYAVSAGNDASDAAIKTPANCADVLTTSAIADFDGKPGGLDPQAAVFSSCEMTGDDLLACFSNFGLLVEIAAPGVQIFSTYIGSGYATKSGTSMASPHVAGVAALDIVVHGKPTDAAGATAVRGRVIADGAPQAGHLGFGGDPDSFAEPLLYRWSRDAHDVAVISVSVPPTFALGDPVPVTALVANRGSSSETFSVSLVASDGTVGGSPQTATLAARASTTLSYTWDTAGLAAGDFTLTADAAAVPDETYTADNTGWIVVTIGHDVAVTEITTPPIIEVGDSVSVDVTATNPGNFSETFQVSLAASGGSVTGSPQPVALAPGASTVVTFTWATTGLTAPADYTLTATASTVPGETDTADNTTEATATLLGHDVAVTAINVPSVVVEGDGVSVAVTAANIGDYSETFEVSLAPSGGSVSGSPQSVTLAAGDAAWLTFTWDTTGLAPADHTLSAVASTVPEETNTADNSRSTVATVRLPEHDVAVTAISAPSAAVSGDSLTVGVTAGNPGTFSETFEVSLTASAGNVSGSPQSLNLAPGVSATLTFTWDTAGAGPGTHTLTATAASVAGETSLANNTLTESPSVWLSPNFVVNSVLDPGSGACDVTECTLREAIAAANASPGAEVIWFAIGSGGVQTIAAASALPSITDPVVIDGMSQPGYAGTPIIELDGTGAGDSADGLSISMGGVTVEGLVVNRFDGDGIELVSGSGNIIQGNYIGTDVDGTADLGNSGRGVFVTAGTADNTIGGTASGARNVISGNGSAGIWIAGSTGNLVQGNFIGTDITGTSDRGNSSYGLSVTGSSSENNRIGGAAPGARNVISGNGSYGINISSASETVVQGNFIGTDITGTADLGNSISGVLIEYSSDNTIGGSMPGEGNVISGNGFDGVTISGSGATWNVLQGNYIGTTADGVAALSNGPAGVRISEGSGNTIGGTMAGAGNVISAHGYGVIVQRPGAMGNLVQGNFIGTDVTGTAALGNADKGVTVSLFAADNVIGGTAPGAGNLISGNGSYGIYISSSSRNLVQGNFIGTDVSGTSALRNLRDGVYVTGASDTTIGGTAPGAGNLISGNGTTWGMWGEDGIHLYPTVVRTVIQGNLIGTDVTGTAALGNSGGGIASTGANNLIGGREAGARNVVSGNGAEGISVASEGTVIEGNFIGTDITGVAALGNSGYGVWVIGQGINGIAIGGTAPGAGNTIAYNDGDGVEVRTTTGNPVRGNSIHSNAGKGIHNVTGGNMELALPSFASLSPLSGIACTGCTVDVYSDDEDEGRIYEGSAVADGLGQWSFAGAVTGPNVTATATDAGGNTSEFAPFTCPDGDVDGVCDATDNCLETPNPDQADVVHPGGGGDACEDPDSDGVFDDCDNCPDTPNAGQEDFDGDALGDACDPDDDNDTVDDAIDNCPFAANPNQTDAVHPGGGGDACEDPDSDGVFDDSDNCPDTPNADQEDFDGDVLGDACDPDDDNDTVEDAIDNCPFTANLNQADAVHPGGGGDACEDPDSDGVFDDSDNCPDTPNADQEDTVHSGGGGDACEDPDSDGAFDDSDNCPDTPNAGQEDFDGDVLGDVCDPDDDNDTVDDAGDNCPYTANPNQSNFDGDGAGDVCDSDDDNDGVDDVAEGECGDSIDNDGNGLVNDGCPQVGAAAESGYECTDADDDDGDGWVNDGCPGNSEVNACGSKNPDPASSPERIDNPFAPTTLDEDGDTEVDEELPSGSAVYDCDGDGYTGADEARIYGTGVSTAPDQDPCGNDGWPSDLFPSGASENKVNLQDAGSFIAPAPRLNTSPGDAFYDVRWDVKPGADPPAFPKEINLLDTGTLLTGTQGYPPMLGGSAAFGTPGPTCPWPP